MRDCSTSCPERKNAFFCVWVCLILVFRGINFGGDCKQTPLERIRNNMDRVKAGKKQRISEVSLLGERNSGTRWIYSHLSNCFNHSVQVEKKLTRYKHWFQHPTTVTRGSSTGVLVVVQVRNVLDWVLGMQEKPHHAPAHLDLNNWKEFVTKKWSTARIGKDLNMSDDAKSGKLGAVCQENFYYKDIVSCHKHPYPEGYWNKDNPHRFSQHEPFYEMKNDGSGQPFENILDMRAAKIKNFLQTRDFPTVSEVIVSRYEDLLTRGTHELVASIEKLVGVKALCDRVPPQPGRGKREGDNGLKQWLMNDNHVDWVAEGMVGYRKDSLEMNVSSFFLMAGDGEQSV